MCDQRPLQHGSSRGRRQLTRDARARTRRRSRCRAGGGRRRFLAARIDGRPDCRQRFAPIDFRASAPDPRAARLLPVPRGPGSGQLRGAVASACARDDGAGSMVRSIGRGTARRAHPQRRCIRQPVARRGARARSLADDLLSSAVRIGTRTGLAPGNDASPDSGRSRGRRKPRPRWRSRQRWAAASLRPIPPGRTVR